MSKIIKSFKIDQYDNSNKRSRYRTLNRLLEDNDEQYIESYDHKIIPKSEDDTYHIVSSGDKDRLDLISYRYYRTPMLWWIIAEASNIIDPFDVPVNTVLRIPSISSLYATGDSSLFIV